MNPTLLLSLTQALTGVLASNPNIPKEIGQGAVAAEASLAVIVNTIHNTSGGVPLNPSTILAAIGGIVAALQADPNLPQNVLAEVQSLNKAITVALSADSAAQQAVDPSILKHIDPIA